MLYRCRLQELLNELPDDVDWLASAKSACSSLKKVSKVSKVSSVPLAPLLLLALLTTTPLFTTTFGCVTVMDSWWLSLVEFVAPPGTPTRAFNSIVENSSGWLVLFSWKKIKKWIVSIDAKYKLGILSIILGFIRIELEIFF